MVIILMKIIYLVNIQNLCNNFIFQVMLAAIQKKNEIDSENNGQNRMVLSFFLSLHLFTVENFLAYVQ